MATRGRGRPRKDVKRNVFLTVRLDEELRERLERLARDSYRSASTEAMLAIRDRVNGNAAGHPGQERADGVTTTGG